jgi:hypothetical protein
VFAKAFPPDTTSNVAGGQWAPASVEHKDKAQFERILTNAFNTHQSRGSAYGVSHKQNYATTRLPSFADVSTGIVPAPAALAHLPFARLKSRGFVYSTLLVEPPIFLPKLVSDLNGRGVPLRTKTFHSMSEVFSDPEISQKVVVNCTGLGAREICNDKKVHAVKGQLVMLPPQPELDYLFCAPGYLFPRQDAVVVGGTEETEFTDDKPDIKRCKIVLAHVRQAFEPSLMSMMTPEALSDFMRPEWLIKDK